MNTFILNHSMQYSHSTYPFECSDETKCFGSNLKTSIRLFPTKIPTTLMYFPLISSFRIDLSLLTNIFTNICSIGFLSKIWASNNKQQWPVHRWIQIWEIIHIDSITLVISKTDKKSNVSSIFLRFELRPEFVYCCA